MFLEILNGYTIFIFIYFILINLTYLGLIIGSLRGLREFINNISSDPYVPSAYTKPISVLVPAFNEQATIVDSVYSLLELNYPQFEIIIINDGSRDETLPRLIDTFGLRRIDMKLRDDLVTERVRGYYSSFERPQLVVVDKENGGKADALNTGINASRYPLFCAVDSDSVVEKNALLRLVHPFLQDDNTVAVGGMVRIANGCSIKAGEVERTALPRKSLVVFQIIEYLRAFLTNRVGWEMINGLVIISGAFGLFRKAVVVEAGGYRRTIGEDMELTVRLHEFLSRQHRDYKVKFASDAVCWTQAPERLKDLKSQRIRWHRGLIDSLLSHRGMLFNPRMGTVGLLALPYFWFIEMLGPIIEGIGYLLLIIAGVTGHLTAFFLWVYLMAVLFGIFFSLAAIWLEEVSYHRYRSLNEISRLILLVLIEQIVYRPLTVYWRIRAFFNYRRGSQRWGSIERKAFTG